MINCLFVFDARYGNKEQLTRTKQIRHLSIELLIETSSLAVWHLMQARIQRLLCNMALPYNFNVYSCRSILLSLSLSP